MNVHHVPGALGGPKTESDSLALMMQAVVSLWEPNLDPAQELHLFLTEEPSPRPRKHFNSYLGQICPSRLLIMPQ